MGGGEPSSSSPSLSDAELRALRGSKFAPLPPPPPPSRTQPRLAHPAGPMTTNKAAALAKFLERKLQQPGGLDSIDPNLLEVAVKNAKETVNGSRGGISSSGRIVRHVTTFGDFSKDSWEDRKEERKQKEKDLGEDQDSNAKRKKKKKDCGVDQDSNAKKKKKKKKPEGVKNCKARKKF